MDSSFWHQKWKNNEIGFHRNAPHEQLITQFPKLQLEAESNVLVPLCGKSKDLLWLSNQNLHVTGVEISELAIESFFKENQLSFTRKGNRFSSGNINLYSQDFLDFTPELTFDAIYDRASLVALPEDMRLKYAKKISSLSGKNCQYLLISFSYPHDLIIAPPFSVDEDQIKRLYGSHFKIEILDRQVSNDLSPKMRASGIDSISEIVYRLIPK